jgi:phospholipase C
MSSSAAGSAASKGDKSSADGKNPAGTEIKHVVHVILENRSFDSVFGYLYDGSTLPQGEYFRGLAFEGGKTMSEKPGQAKSADSGSQPPTLDFEFSSHHGVSTDKDGVKVNVPARIRNRGAVLSVEDVKKFGHWPPLNPGEEHEHATAQLYGVPKGTKVDWKVDPKMEGAPDDYKTHHPDLPESAEIIMTCLPKQLLPTMNMLATQHAVCDEWFCSMPTQTWPNRLFAWTGSSANIVNNHVKDDYKPVTAQITEHFKSGRVRNIFNVMDIHHRPEQMDANRGVPKSEEEGLKSDWTWRVYSHLPYLDTFTMLLYKLATSDRIDDAYCHINDLSKHANEGTLAAYSLVEPLFMPTKINGEPRLHNDQHPSEFMESGEKYWTRPPIWECDRMLLELYKALFGPHAKHRDSTLLLITYDEHGGCYDHVAPPIVPSNMRDKLDTEAPAWESTGFHFDRYGVRVPTILVSPRIAPNTILHAPGEVPFDHCSLLRSIRERWTKDGTAAPPLSNREAGAPTFWGVLNVPSVNLYEFDARFATNVAACEASLAALDALHATTGSWWNPVNWLNAATDLAKATVTSVVQAATASASTNRTLGNLAYLFAAPHTRMAPPSGTSSHTGGGDALDWSRFAEMALSIESEKFASNMRASETLVTPKFDNTSMVPVTEGAATSPAAIVGVKRALLIGAYYDKASNEKGISTLNGTINDVDLMFTLLTEQFEFKPEQIIKLSSKDATDPLYASKANIMDHFVDLAKATQVEDVFVLYYSGHGSEIADDSKPNGRSQVIVPSGCTEVSAEQCVTDVEVEKILMDHFKTKKNKADDMVGAKNVTLIFDSCHSGDMTREIDGTPKARPEGAVVRQVPSTVPGKEQQRSIGGPDVKSRPDWSFSQYCEYVAFSACHSSSESIEMAFTQAGGKIHGVFTFYLDKALREMMSKAKETINWRQVLRAVQQGIRETKTAQVPQLEGLCDWVPFSSFARPLVPHTLVHSMDSNRFAKLKGGFLHGITLGSQWIVTTRYGWKFKLEISKILQGASSDGSVDCPEDGIVAFGYISANPSFVPPGADEKKASEQDLADAFAVCISILNVNLPTIFLDDKSSKRDFSLSDLKTGFPSFYHDVSDRSIADVIVEHEDRGTHLLIPSLGNGWMTSGLLKVKYAELSRIGFFVRTLRHHMKKSGCAAMLEDLTFKIGNSTAETIFLSENASEQSVSLLNSSDSAWFLTLLAFHPDFAIDQLFPARGNNTNFVKVKVPAKFRVRPGALRDGHGNARIVIRAIVTSKEADFSMMVQPPVQLSQEPTKEVLKSADNPSPELRGFVVVDKEVILQPDSIESAIREGLIYNAKWNSPYRNDEEGFKNFLVLRNALLGTGSTPSNLTSNRYSSAYREPWAINSLIKVPVVENEIISAVNGANHKVILLSCFDSRQNLFGNIKSEQWIPFQLNQKPGTATLKDLDFQAFDDFMTTDNATGFTIVVHGNAVHALKHHLTSTKSNWTMNIKYLVFLNAVHAIPTMLTNAGLICMLPYWRTISSLDEVNEWAKTIAELDGSFLKSPFATLPILSINTPVPIELFASQGWTAPPVKHQTIEAPDVHFFDLPFVLRGSQVHKDILGFGLA